MKPFGRPPFPARPVCRIRVAAAPMRPAHCAKRAPATFRRGDESDSEKCPSPPPCVQPQSAGDAPHSRTLPEKRSRSPLHQLQVRSDDVSELARLILVDVMGKVGAVPDDHILAVDRLAI